MTAQTIVDKFVALGGSEIEFDYKKQISIIHVAIATLNKQLNTLVEQYQEICPHTNIDHQKKHYSGGYDYSAETHHTYTCEDCGVVNREVQNHNSGFE